MQLESKIDIYTQDKANLISDVQVFDKLSQAVSQNRRQDFSLLLAFLCSDITQGHFENELYAQDQISDEKILQSELEIPENQRLIAEDIDYQLCNQQAIAFHQAGIKSAKLNHYLTPSALHFSTEKTYGLGEEVYHNLSGHDRRNLTHKTEHSISKPSTKLYQQLQQSLLESSLVA